MTDSIGDLLQKRDFDEPPEVKVIKKFIWDSYGCTCAVKSQQNEIIIQVSGAALAGTLRMRLPELRKLCQTEKRLIIRIN